MPTLKLGAATLNQTPLDWEGNLRRIRQVLREARARRVGLLCLPELCLTGYGCEDAFGSPSVVGQAQAALQALLPETRDLVVALGLPVLHRGGLFAAAAVVCAGRILGVVAKRHLAGDGIHYEPRWFKPWPDGAVAEVELAGQVVPMGDVVFEVGSVRFGLEICEDAWAANRPGARLAAAGIDVILNPSASHFAFGKLEVRRRFIREGSRAFATNYLYANLVGNEAGRAIYDGGAMVASLGEILAQGPRFGFEEAALTVATVDLDHTRMAAARVASFQPDPRTPSGLVHVDHVWPESSDEPPPAEAVWESSPHLKEEELTRALSLALFDYLRKSRAQGFVVSSSGGCDSAATACLCSMALRFASAALGEEGLRARLAHIGDWPVGLAAQRQRWLTTLYQATAQSSQTTREAARQVALASGARHLELEVEGLAQAYVGLLQGALGRTLSWQRDDLALQNIQARVRGPSAWLVANVENKLLLTTSNRSEAAAGYATMDGDTCGGLAPLAGIDKAFLRRWLAWLAGEGPVGLGPLPQLQAVVVQHSTPELRPPSARQISEEELMPFTILDRVERLGIRDKLAPSEVYRRLCAEQPELPPAQLAAWVERFFVLFARNQWKRERYAPSFHVDDENLDPRSWCRFPILSGGFAAELRQLREVAGLPAGGKP